MAGRARKRSGGALAAGVLAALATAPSALGAQVTVNATPDTRFSPARVTIAPGDSVVWRNLGGDHNVRFDDGAFEQPAAPSSLSWTTPARVFPAAGRFSYYCELHGGPNRSGMSGEVVVAVPGSDTTKPVVTRPRLRPRARRLRLRFVSSEPGRAVVKFQRRDRRGFKRVRTVRRKVSRGKSSVVLRRDSRGRVLAPGRYRAIVTVRDPAGNLSRPARASARISRPS